MANGVTTEDPWTHKLTGKTWEMLVLLSTKRPVFFGKRVTKIVSCRFFSGVRQMFMIFHTDARINFCLHSCEQAVLSLQTPKPDIHVACTFLQGHRRLPQTTPATNNRGDDPKHCEKTKRETMRIMRNQWLNPMVYQWFLDVSGCFWSVNASFNRQKSKRATVVCPSRIDMPGRTFSAGGIEASGLKKVGIDSLICRCILSVQALRSQALGIRFPAISLVASKMKSR